MNASLKLKKHLIFLLVLSVALSIYTALFGHMNNWLIFRASFTHLIEGTSLYIHYPSEHHDLYKYSPTFALLMAPFHLFPIWLGAVLWNLAGACFFIFALLKWPLSDNQKIAIFWISLPEFIGSTQGFQSNIHTIAFLMLWWVYLEEQKPIQGALNLLGSFFIKIFGFLGGCLLLFKPYSYGNPLFFIRLAISLSCILFTFLLLPCLIIGCDSLNYQYNQWIELLSMDAAASHGFSLMGVLHGFTGWDFENLPFQLAGGLSLIASYFYFREGNREARILGFVSLCYFLILFNHKSESPTFIIAMVAFGIHQGLILNRRLRWGLIIFTLACVSLLYSDLFKDFKQSHFDVYAVKAWPFLILYPLSLTGFGTPASKKDELEE